MSDARMVTAAPTTEDAVEASIRPQSLEEFVGQQQLRDNLKVFIAAARGRRDALDHVLLHGPPGLGKTTLAQIVARELGVGFRMISGQVTPPADILTPFLHDPLPHDVRRAG